MPGYLFERNCAEASLGMQGLTPTAEAVGVGLGESLRCLARA